MSTRANSSCAPRVIDPTGRARTKPGLDPRVAWIAGSSPALHRPAQATQGHTLAHRQARTVRCVTVRWPMSDMGHERPSTRLEVVSALLLKADLNGRTA